MGRPRNGVERDAAKAKEGHEKKARRAGREEQLPGLSSRKGGKREPLKCLNRKCYGTIEFASQKDPCSCLVGYGGTGLNGGRADMRG